MKKVSIYTTPTCTYCRAAKGFFHQNNVAHEEFDVSTDAAKREEMIEKSGQMGVPVVMISDVDEKGEKKEPVLIVGFDRTRLSQALGIS